jgi:transaldolase/glucose-6-phosphate isomerase
MAMRDIYDIGQEFFRWELATAVAGSVIGVNPFDQPDVEASKVKTRSLMKNPESLAAADSPIFRHNGISLFAAGDIAHQLSQGSRNSLAGVLDNFFQASRAGDYCALLAYFDPTDELWGSLQRMRSVIRDRRQIATCVGVGPRFLHSTGQAYKGGPNTGIFVQLTSRHPHDISVPGHPYSFGTVIDATAQGDFEVLNERRRRAVHVHFTGDLRTGLHTLEQAISEALA